MKPSNNFFIKTNTMVERYINEYSTEKTRSRLITKLTRQISHVTFTQDELFVLSIIDELYPLSSSRYYLGAFDINTVFNTLDELVNTITTVALLRSMKKIDNSIWVDILTPIIYYILHSKYIVNNKYDDDSKKLIPHEQMKLLIIYLHNFIQGDTFKTINRIIAHNNPYHETVLDFNFKVSTKDVFRKIYKDENKNFYCYHPILNNILVSKYGFIGHISAGRKYITRLNNALLNRYLKGESNFIMNKSPLSLQTITMYYLSSMIFLTREVALYSSDNTSMYISNIQYSFELLKTIVVSLSVDSFVDSALYNNVYRQNEPATLPNIIHDACNSNLSTVFKVLPKLSDHINIPANIKTVNPYPFQTRGSNNDRYFDIIKLLPLKCDRVSIIIENIVNTWFS